MKPNELKIGHVYFSCGWSHRKYPVPVIKTYVFIGKNLYDDRENKSQDDFAFESPLKYFENDLLNGLSEEVNEENDGPEEPTQMVIPEDSLEIIKDIDGLIDFIERTKNKPNVGDIF